MTPMEPRFDANVLSARLARLIRLDSTVFDEVKDDAAATLPAVLVAIMSTLLAALGGWVWWMVQGYGADGRVFRDSVIVGSLFSFALWIVWLLMAWVILTQLFGEEADWQQMLRTMGLATLPLALSVLMFIPGIDMGLALASIVLFFGLTTIAIQAVTTANPARVLVANLAGFSIWAVVLGLLVGNDHFYAPGIFLFGAPVDYLQKLMDASNLSF